MLCILICINSGALPLKWLTEQKNPFKVWKLATWYNEFGYNNNNIIIFIITIIITIIIIIIIIIIYYDFIRVTKLQ